jgi:hypothetical protein
VLKATLDPKVHKVHKELHQIFLALKVLKDHKVSLGYKDHKVLKEIRDPKAHKVLKET